MFLKIIRKAKNGIWLRKEKYVDIVKRFTITKLFSLFISHFYIFIFECNHNKIINDKNLVIQRENQIALKWNIKDGLEQ